MTCPSCGYPETDRIGDWCPLCVAQLGVRNDGSRPWANQSNPMPFEQSEIDDYNRRQSKAASAREGDVTRDDLIESGAADGKRGPKSGVDAHQRHMDSQMTGFVRPARLILRSVGTPRGERSPHFGNLGFLTW